MLRNFQKPPFGFLFFAVQHSTKVCYESKLLRKESESPFPVKDFPLTKYGGEYTITLLTGTDSGQNASSYIKRVFYEVNAPVRFEEVSTDSLSAEYVTAIKRNGAALFIDILHENRKKQASLLINNDLDLYACIMKCIAFPAIKTIHPAVNIAVIMQNNYGDFSKLEYEPTKGVVETLNFSQYKKILRYLNFVFEYVNRSGRRKITIAHKKTELPFSESMPFEIAIKLKRDKYPQIQVEEMLVNSIARKLVMNPHQFDVICTNEKYGTFVATICSSICGGPTLFCAKDYGDNHAVFKPLQTKLSLSDSDTLCPYGVVSAGICLLNHLKCRRHAQDLWKALIKTMAMDKILTPELGGIYTNDDVICKMLKNIKKILP